MDPRQPREKQSHYSVSAVWGRQLADPPTFSFWRALYSHVYPYIPESPITAMLPFSPQYEVRPACTLQCKACVAWRQVVLQVLTYDLRFRMP